MQHDMSKVVNWMNSTINKACVSDGFLHLIKNWLQSVVLLFFLECDGKFTCHSKIIYLLVIN